MLRLCTHTLGSFHKSSQSIAQRFYSRRSRHAYTHTEPHLTTHPHSHNSISFASICFEEVLSTHTPTQNYTQPHTRALAHRNFSRRSLHRILSRNQTTTTNRKTKSPRLHTRAHTPRLSYSHLLERHPSMYTHAHAHTWAQDDPAAALRESLMKVTRTHTWMNGWLVG